MAISDVYARHELIFADIVKSRPYQGTERDKSVMHKLVFVLVSGSREATMGLHDPASWEIQIY